MDIVKLDSLLGHALTANSNFIILHNQYEGFRQL